MRARLIYPRELTSSDLDRWRELAAVALEPNPFYEPEYVLPLLTALGQDSATPILVVEDAAGWRGCLPLNTGRWHRIPAPAFAGWRGHPLYSLLGTPLVSSERADAALATLIHAMLNTRRVGFAALDWVADDGAFARTLRELLAGRSPAAIPFERFERAALRRRPEPTYLEESLSAKRRRELRRQRRKIAESLGSEPVTVDRAGHDRAYDDFIALEAEDGGGRKSVLAATPAHARFFREVCRGFAEQGRLQMLSLEAGGNTLAAKCNIVAGGVIFCVKIAYDKRWAQLSPGIQLEVDMLKIFHDGSMSNLMDSCADSRNPMMNRLWPDRRAIASYVLPADHPLGRATVPGLLAARSLRSRRQRRRYG